MDEGRRRHYGTFYGLDPLPEEGRVLVVYGNCQAEALRVAMTWPGDLVGVRMPPVHELVAEDLPHLERVLSRADVLVAQPVRDGYRDLPLGDAQIAQHLPGSAQVVRIPVVFYRGLHPFQVVVHSRGVVDPPLVPYQDLRWIAEAAGLGSPRLSAEAVRSMAATSMDELRRRERELDLVPVADLVEAAGSAAMHTVNHPGNKVLLRLAERLRARLGLAESTLSVDRELLRSIYSPLLPEVLDALDLEGEPSRTWTVDGREVTDDEVRHAHLAWLAEHPVAVEATVERHGDLLRLLGAA